MKGLFVKDLMIIRHQMTTFIMFILCAAVLSMTMESYSAVYYMMFLGSALIVGTLSYDEVDNGYTFLFTLPFQRRDYAREKFLLCTAGMIVSAVIGYVIAVISVTLRGGTAAALFSQALPGVVGMFFGLSLFHSVMIPLRIRYGSEKGRLVLYILSAAMAALFILALKLTDYRMPSFAVSDTVIAAVLITAGIVIMIIGEKITEKILKKKEF